ncbi:MAG: carboxypeptidase M32, partial [Halapricum sp.]
MAATAEEPPQPYRELLEEYRRVSNLSAVTGLLSWDQQVMMPDDGNPARSQQLSTLSGLKHELLTDDSIADALDAVDEGSLTDQQRAVVREIRREHDRAAAVPQNLVETLSAKSSEALEIWESAKADADFSQFAPILEELVELRREYAEHIDPDREP